jgi:hypothetical protein
MKIIQKFTILDQFQNPFQIAQIVDPPSFLVQLISKISSTNIRLALDRYAEPLIFDLKYTPKECLQRIPSEKSICILSKSCFGYKKSCLNLATNKCLMLQLPNNKNTLDQDLTDIVNLWRDNYYVIQEEN